MTTNFPLDRRPALLLSAVIIELTIATAYVHYTLGGTLFLLNALGYVALAAVYAVAVLAPLTIVRRFGWLARIGLAGYTLLTIAAYVVIGPYFALGWIAKGIEVAIVGLVALDLLGLYGSPAGVVRAAVTSVSARGAGRGLQRG